MGTDSATIFVRLSDIVGANRNQPTIGNLELTVELSFRLPAVLGAETSTAENQNHWMLPLQFGQFPALGRVVGKLEVGKGSSWDNVRSQSKSSTRWMRRRIAPQCLVTVLRLKLKSMSRESEDRHEGSLV